jgi:hypothetical protein
MATSLLVRPGRGIVHYYRVVSEYWIVSIAIELLPYCVSRFVSS